MARTTAFIRRTHGSMPLSGSRPSLRQPGDHGGEPPQKPRQGPWLCVPAFRPVCLFEDELRSFLCRSL